MSRTILLPTLLLALTLPATAQIRVLIVDGQNNHVVWPKSTVMMKQYLEDTGLFTVDVRRSAYTWNADEEADFLPLAGAGPSEDLPKPQPDPDFAPDFADYDVVISNFGWQAAPWPKATQAAFDAFVKNGGGFVSVHAADNSFPEWPAYNRMIGLGGWGGRDESSGPYVYYDNRGELIRDDSPGKGGIHGAQHEFPVTVREKDHPITQGMPDTWMTTADECYAMMRGPAENLTVLATGKDLSDTAPTNRHEPVLMTVTYGDGRIFHTTLGHDTQSIQGVGFITSFLRGVEWAATGEVTQEIPDDFPTADEATRRTFKAASGPR
ncbi:type 1 glutamine amidotransferase [Neolewinella xylanilytica]|uniref:Type 1 glutamine amidotransferase n=1 Tax=Neolewinella xylanilytica TaxID=1514080 RepID=A0A2S6I7B4_9BACT|nr:ThuA domain-containing protein [Neolewinella xylanilytica]PPK87393.1 type 1 glutamine amidotransferase [Neolewinella xylanilytica]